ncbi:Integral membrane protein [Streptococcus sp. DD10]|uniref:beta-carotene 15,15'-monooxygenase n=1 Tax=Streptococcus sp. DD10 TaxID=1777878 RepID=UPI00079A9502|nr:beta-carotene 15,15'-monooxygenase [Streptococcus sp. DD10]KXT72611.1 Integral membrane protein [Streptococcus sp. DD10]
MFKRFFFNLYQFGYYACLLIATIIIGFLAIQSLLGGTFIPLTIAEGVIFTNNPLSIYFAVFAFILLLIFLRSTLDRVNSKQLFLFWTILYVLAATYLIMGHNGVIRADARHVYKAAIAFNQGDYSSLTTTGDYMYRNPHQLGLMTLERLYTMIFPTTQFAFVLNLIWTLGSNFLIAKITKLLFKKDIIVKYTILLTFIFFPNFLFILFVYGSVPGLFFCLLALYCFIKIKKGSFWYMIAGSLAISIACLLRNNYQIFALMLIACLFLNLLSKSDWKKLLAIFMVTIGLFFSGKAIKQYYSEVIGQHIGNGTPLISYVTMGLRDDPNRATLGGWYDGYNTKILKRFNYDEEKASNQAKEDLLKRLAIFFQQPSYALKFFYEKIRSTWTEPTFQSIWTGPQIERRQYTYTNFLRSIYEGRNGYHLANKFGMTILITTYLCTSLYLIYKLFWEKLSLDSFELYPYIFFVGGFLFHIFWETKSQYVYMYVLLLMPSLAQVLVTLSDISQKWKIGRIKKGYLSKIYSIVPQKNS